MCSRMGAEARERTADLSEMQITVLEPGTTEGEKVSGKLKRVCLHCGTEFEAYPSVLNRPERGKFCSRACAGKYRSEHYVGVNNPTTGKPSPFKGCKRDPATGAKISAAKKGIPKSKEHREKLAAALRGKELPESTKKKISEAMKGRTRSPDYCKHISEAKKGVPRPDMAGENNPVWNGGSSFEPYCPKFTLGFRERVRAFFGYQCVECGAPQNGKRLHVHHVNFRKDACCSDEVIPLFVPLCHSCHGNTQKDRPYWEQHFTEMINQYYGGKCYLTKEEMKAYREAR